MDMPEIEVQVARIDEQIKTVQQRLDNLEALTKSVHEMSVTMAKMMQIQTAQAESLKRVSEEVASIKEQPAKRWESVVTGLLGAAVGAVAGFLFS